MDSSYQAILAVINVVHVVGKDENSEDLQLTRVYTHRYDKHVETGEIGPDHNDEGSTLFVGSLDVNAVMPLLQANCAPEWNITVIDSTVQTGGKATA